MKTLNIFFVTMILLSPSITYAECPSGQYACYLPSKHIGPNPTTIAIYPRNVPLCNPHPWMVWACEPACIHTNYTTLKNDAIKKCLNESKCKEIGADCFVDLID